MKKQDKSKNNYYNLPKEKTFLISQKALIHKGKKLLVIKFPEPEDTEWIGEWNGTWGLPGGLLEMNEDMKDGLLREVAEETNLEIEINNVFGIGEMRYGNFIFRDGRKMNVRIIELGYLCTYKNGTVKLSEEHSEYRWVATKELSKLRFSPDSVDLVKQYINEL